MRNNPKTLTKLLFPGESIEEINALNKSYSFKQLIRSSEKERTKSKSEQNTFHSKAPEHYHKKRLRFYEEDCVLWKMWSQMSIEGRELFLRLCHKHIKATSASPYLWPIITPLLTFNILALSASLTILLILKSNAAHVSKLKNVLTGLCITKAFPICLIAASITSLIPLTLIFVAAIFEEKDIREKYKSIQYNLTSGINIDSDPANEEIRRVALSLMFLKSTDKDEDSGAYQTITVEHLSKKRVFHKLDLKESLFLITPLTCVLLCVTGIIASPVLAHFDLLLSMKDSYKLILSLVVTCVIFSHILAITSLIRIDVNIGSLHFNSFFHGTIDVKSGLHDETDSRTLTLSFPVNEAELPKKMEFILETEALFLERAQAETI